MTCSCKVGPGKFESEPARVFMAYQQMWSWTIVFRDAPDVIWHIVRRTGNLKRWTA
jgi:hypothetical protein